jgi:hypothetical protein
VAVCPDGQTVFTGGDADSGRSWDIGSSKLLGKLADKVVGDNQAATFLPAFGTFSN